MTLIAIPLFVRDELWQMSEPALHKSRQREHFWDAVRAFLMLLGIPYHTALSYRSGQSWIVNSGEGLPIFTYLAEWIHIFRMPGFFLIAGYFAMVVLERRSLAQWLSGRFQKLGIPFLFSILTLVPAMNLVCELSNFAALDALASWTHNASKSGGYWVRHLWFIIVLLYCCTITAVLAGKRPAIRHAKLPAAIDRALSSKPAILLLGIAIMLGLWEAIAIELFYIGGLATNFPQEILRLDEFLTYAPYFLIGAVFARAPNILARLCRFSISIALISLISVTASLVLLDDLSPPVGRFVSTFGALSMTQLVIATARLLVDRPIPLVQNFVSASFVMYLFHMPFIIFLVWLGQGIAMPVALKAVTVMVLALAFSYAAWWLVSRSATLALMFNGGALPPRLRLRTA